MQLGLIGKSLSHSFSKAYFHQKFEREKRSGYSYRNFELQDISEFPALLAQNPELHGLNVTLPYKEAVIPYLDALSPEARKIGAVNTIALRHGRSTGFNTDHSGFRQSLEPLLQPRHKKALILGTGGASRAVAHALKQLQVSYLKVSRQPKEMHISYAEAAEKLASHYLVVHTTPVGTYPQVRELPPLILENVSKNHLFYDLVYNPPQSRLLSEAQSRGAQIKNGSEMLVLQAEEAWKIWHQV